VALQQKECNRQLKRDIIRTLHDGLILRRARPADGERLVEAHADLHRDPGMEEPDEGVGAWVRDLLERPHPTFEPEDFTLVEEPRDGRIVSSLCLISQTWSYGGIEFGVGRPELVATHPDYRQQGLIRAQFEMIHAWSADRGEEMQAITGIPWYYRQFGYEMALDLGGGRAGYLPHVPQLKEGEEEAYSVRPAGEEDVPFLLELDRRQRKRSMVTCVWDEETWRYELAGKSAANVNRSEFRILERDGEAVGMVAHPPSLWGTMLPATSYELKAGASWLAASPAVVRYLWQTGQDYARAEGKEGVASFGFWLGSEHPAYQALAGRLPYVRKPYAWYLRVPDLPGFVQRIAPVLEERLAGSVAAGHSGELKISFYRDGLRLSFDEGCIRIQPWKTVGEKGANAAFPGLTFLQLLFGYRSLQELDEALADCFTTGDEARVLLDALFPKPPSSVRPVS
jgi:GNAT superfamily N-acetyltransferase